MSVKGAGKPSMWTPEEDRVIREHYPSGGAVACVAHLKGRTVFAVYARAFRRLGLKRKPSLEVASTCPHYAPEGVDEVIRAWAARRYGGAT